MSETTGSSRGSKPSPGDDRVNRPSMIAAEASTAAEWRHVLERPEDRALRGQGRAYCWRGGDVRLKPATVRLKPDTTILSSVLSSILSSVLSSVLSSGPLVRSVRL